MVEIWECQFDELTKTDELMRQLVRDESDLKHPLKPRDALSGGRTNAFVLHYEGDVDYIDFTSLYPYVQKYGTFPIGHPEIITENFDACIDNYFGLVFCQSYRLVIYTIQYYRIMQMGNYSFRFVLFERSNHNKENVSTMKKIVV
jgi:hypothetical protein